MLKSNFDINIFNHYKSCTDNIVNKLQYYKIKKNNDVYKKQNEIYNQLLYLRKYNLRHFIPFCFNNLVGEEYQDNWHIGAVSECLEACFTLQIRKLVVNMPPRSLKSMCCSVAFPMWVLGHESSSQFMCVSHRQDVAQGLSRYSRIIANTQAYKIMFPDFKFASDQNSVVNFATTQNGYRYVATSSSVPTGKGFDYLVLDDYIRPDLTKHEMEVAIENIPNFLNRANNKKKSVVIVVEQKINHNDASGYCLKKWEHDKDFYHLKLPMIETRNRVISINGFKKERKVGELLHPDRDNLQIVEQLKKDMGSVRFETQYQQEPCIENGEIIKKQYFCYEYMKIIQDMSNCEMWLSCDTAFKDKQSNDPSALLVLKYNRNDNKAYLMYISNERLLFTDLLKKIIDLSVEYKIKNLLIEDKAGGPDLINYLQKNTNLNVLAYNVKGQDKRQRLSAASPFIEAGRLVLPKEDLYWRTDFEKQLLEFPMAQHDDMVDAISQFINYLNSTNNIIINDFINIFKK